MSKKRKDENGKISQAALDFVRQQSQSTESVGDGIQADWTAVQPNLVLGALYAACRGGAAILYGSDRSGVLYSVTLYISGEKVTKYFHCVREFDKLEEYLQEIMERLQ